MLNLLLSSILCDVFVAGAVVASKTSKVVVDYSSKCSLSVKHVRFVKQKQFQVDVNFFGCHG